MTRIPKKRLREEADSIHQMTYDSCEDLISTDVGDNELSLIIQHLLKVWNMPVFIRGVAVKALPRTALT